ncbi:MAG: hypothetical protein HYV16_01700 [Gammaproteobacteria bacterium]|nr:hypothetical protein [Gammaproteobacteria bacterium]
MTAHEHDPTQSSVQAASNEHEETDRTAVEQQLRRSRRRRNGRSGGGGGGRGGGSLVSNPRDKMAKEPAMGLLLLVAGALGLAMKYFFN